MLKDSVKQIRFGCQGKCVEMAFDGGAMTSDGGIVFDHQNVQGSTVNLRHKIFPSKRRTRSQGKRIRSLSVGESELRPQNRHSLPKFQSSLLPARLATTGAKVPMYGSRTTK